MPELARRLVAPPPDAPAAPIPTWSDLSFHRPPDAFLPLVSPRAWKALCGILVEVWSKARHIVKTNHTLMQQTGLKRSALIAGLRELESAGIITCFPDPDHRANRIIQLNWTLRIKSGPEAGPLRMVGPDDANPSPPVRPSEPPPSGHPNPPLKNLGAQGSAFRTPRSGPPDPPGSDPRTPPVRPAEPPSSMRDSKEIGEKKRQEGPASSSGPGESGPPTPAAEGGEAGPPFTLAGWKASRSRARPAEEPPPVGLDPVLAREYRLPEGQAEELRRVIARAGDRPPADLARMLARHDAAVRLIGPAPEPPAGPSAAAIAADLARGLSRGAPPAAGPVRQDRPGRRRGGQRP